ncbi:MAG: HD domain-containing protein [Erysipelotrichaceae bacterium]|nr:HD domain-containing protein [Erysipelotrichaceae bacterium]
MKYCEEIPVFLQEAAYCPSVQRLKHIGMNCGCEYTAYELFRTCGSYSRYEHSLGVSQIVWNFTHDPRQAMAGLLHDIATPVFAHVIDFMNGDHMKQESTEAGTREIIDGDEMLQSILKKNGLCTEDVCDYHRYPVADNDSPKLSADRLEYTLKNAVYLLGKEEAQLQKLYDDLAVFMNEEGEKEIQFLHADEAERFGFLSLQCSRIYVSDTDRCVMQVLAELVREAILLGVLSSEDLYTDEPSVIAKLCADPYMRGRWEHFRKLNRIETDGTCRGEGWYQIRAKKRRIDPLIYGKGRLTEVCEAYRKETELFVNEPQEYWVHADISE